MAIVVLNTDDLTVFGPPDALDLSVDIGPEGQRGSQIFVGSGAPSPTSIPSALLNDIYINAAPGPNFSWLYQYQVTTSPSVPRQWVPVLRLNPTIYSEISATTYTAGEAQIVIPVSNILSTSGITLTAENFVIQHNIINDKPVSSALTVEPLSGGGTNLVLNIKAIEWDSTTSSWVNLSGIANTHIFITVVL